MTTPDDLRGKSPIRAVIFDLDGCLVDSEVMSLECLIDEMRAEGVDATFNELRRRFLGLSIQAVSDQIAGQTGRAVAADFPQRFEDRLLARYPGELKAMPGVTDLLDQLQAQGVQTAIATGGSVRRMTAALTATGLLAHFQDRAFSADQVARGKPAPDLFLLAADRLGVSPGACAVMEDSPLGVQGARAAGMRAVGFVGGSHLRDMADDQATRLRDAGAVRVLDDLAGMADALLDAEPRA